MKMHLAMTAVVYAFSPVARGGNERVFEPAAARLPDGGQ